MCDKRHTHNLFLVTIITQISGIGDNKYATMRKGLLIYFHSFILLFDILNVWSLWGINYYNFFKFHKSHLLLLTNCSC